MQTEVVLQDPFSYYIGPIFIGLVIVVGLILVFIIRCMEVRKKQKSIEHDFAKQEMPLKGNLLQVKRNYLRQIEQIQSNLSNEECDLRTAYQSLSICLRGFVSEITGINVKNATLYDIKAMNMPYTLINLIEEYYSPEFAEETIGNFTKSLEKTKQVIQQWN